MSLDLVGRWNVAKKRVQKRKLNNIGGFGLVHAYIALGVCFPTSNHSFAVFVPFLSVQL